ncbi:hypothetical protein PMIT1313_02630 [Prochlorococcus marinus str. MIT 1313]|uniref:hypothetical protein n=1 Tax=Prochlorococcus TaxID=1218 RepID=UPI0007C10BE3|nr:hypothetical protein [Prochlorococcus marinus]KZR67762.1 hypothetical protein PMIT1313_02630 [Prochlorococcus marinus str. MIT 1313]MEC7381782.1 hypothetical protein [Cyanobacteriota bacterium]
MNILSMIQRKAQKQAALSHSQFLMAKSYRGIDYTSAHQSPAKLAVHTHTNRGVDYTI